MADAKAICILKDDKRKKRKQKKKQSQKILFRIKVKCALHYLCLPVAVPAVP